MGVLTFRVKYIYRVYRGRNPGSGGLCRCNVSSRVLCLIVVIGLCVGIIAMSTAHADTSNSREYKIKAAFLYNLAKFVEWPAEALGDDDKVLVLGLLGDDPFNQALDALEGKAVKGKKLEVRKFAGMGDIEELKKCHIIFISSSEREYFSLILEALKNSHALIVGDTEGFAEIGGIINFIIVENKVRFEINVDAQERAGLKISSKLLKLAKIIREKHRGEDN